MHYFYLFLAIITETIGTAALQASHQFTRFWPSVLVIAGYIGSFWFMALTLRVMPLGIVYAIWSGLGMVFIAVIGWWMFNQKLDTPAILGLTMILGGVLVIHLFSDSSTH